MLERASLETFDKTKQTVAFRCAICRWKFRCPVEQLKRVICRACESRQGAEAVAQAQ